MERKLRLRAYGLLRPFRVESNISEEGMQSGYVLPLHSMRAWRSQFASLEFEEKAIQKYVRPITPT